MSYDAGWQKFSVTPATGQSDVHMYNLQGAIALFVTKRSNSITSSNDMHTKQLETVCRYLTVALGYASLQ